MRKSLLAGKVLLGLGMVLPMTAAAAFNYWNVAAPDSLNLTPAKLSLTGLYTNITAAKKTLLANAYHFEVNSPLWSDGAHKTRWVMLAQGDTITYKEKDDYWGYPNRAVFIKEFDIDTVPGDTTTRLMWETRFLINAKDTVRFDSTSQPGKKIPVLSDHWYGYSYIWNRDQKDAILVAREGLDTTLRVFPNGRTAPAVLKKWHFPSRDQCAMCHRVTAVDTVHGRSVLGFFTAQLNRPHPDVSPTINQLEYFFQKGVLKGTKSVWDSPSTPRWRAVDDSSASVDLRARSYIASNCSGCHGRRGMKTGATFGASVNYDFFTMETQMEFRHYHTVFGYYLDTIPPVGMAKNKDDKYFYPLNDGNNPLHLDSIEILPALVVPGYPEKSVLLYRQRQRNTRPAPDFDLEGGQMPPLAISFEVNVAANNLLNRWVSEMARIQAPNAVGIRTVARSELKGPAIQGGMVVLPKELAGTGLARVTLTGIDGRTVELKRRSAGAYALPSGRMTPGVYIIRVDNKPYTRYIF